MNGTIVQQSKIIKHFIIRYKPVISQTKVNYNQVNLLPISGYIANKVKSKLIGFM